MLRNKRASELILPRFSSFWRKPKTKRVVRVGQWRMEFLHVFRVSVTLCSADASCFSCTSHTQPRQASETCILNQRQKTACGTQSIWWNELFSSIPGMETRNILEREWAAAHLVPLFCSHQMRSVWRKLCETLHWCGVLGTSHLECC